MFSEEIAKQPVVQAIWNNTTDLIVFADVSRRIVEINTSALNEFGFVREDLNAEPVSFLLKDISELEKIDNILSPSLEHCEIESYTVRYRRKNETMFWGDTRGCRVVDEQGQLLGVLLIISDLTELLEYKQEAEQNEKYIRCMSEIANVGYWKLDVLTKTVCFSDFLFELFEFKDDPSGFNYLALLDFVHESDRDDFQHVLEQAIATGESFECRTRVSGSSGKIRYLLIDGSVEYSADGLEVISLFGACADISEMQMKEELIFESNKLTDFVMDSIPIRVFWKDLESRYLGCNSQFAKDAGCRSPEEVVGKTDYELFGQESAESFRLADRDVIETGESKMSYEEMQHRHDGSVGWLQTSKIPLRSIDGDIIGIIGTYEDITARKEREQRLALSYYCTEQVKSAVFWCNPDGSFFYVNQTACDWLGYAKSELMSMHVADINPEFPLEAWVDHWRDIKKNKMTHMESYHQRKNGEVYPVELYSNYVVHNEQEFKISFVFDISERRESERKIKEYQDNLETLVEQRTNELREINEELRSFAYSVSHDLRAPLRGIDGFGQALLEDYGQDLDKTAKHYISRIRGGTQKMSSLIDDILYLSRVTQLDINYGWVDIESSSKAIVAEFQSQYPERNVVTQIDEKVFVWADEKLMRIALLNLLGNAWKYTSKLDIAEIRIKLTSEGEFDVLSVADNGVGFEEQYAQNLFTPFQRLHRAEEFEGNGIGLATVKRIVGKHGGSVYAKSVVGKGATFFVKLPKRRSNSKDD